MHDDPLMRDYAHLPRRTRQTMTEIIRATPPQPKPATSWYGNLFQGALAAGAVFAGIVTLFMLLGALEDILKGGM